VERDKSRVREKKAGVSWAGFEAVVFDEGQASRLWSGKLWALRVRMWRVRAGNKVGVG
jgi:hypothetical protein